MQVRILTDRSHLHDALVDLPKRVLPWKVDHRCRGYEVFEKASGNITARRQGVTEDLTVTIKAHDEETLFRGMALLSDRMEVFDRSISEIVEDDLCLEVHRTRKGNFIVNVGQLMEVSSWVMCD